MFLCTRSRVIASYERIPPCAGNGFILSEDIIKTTSMENDIVREFSKNKALCES